METRHLLCDVHSYLSGQECYGRKGDIVSIISLRGHVAIVQNEAGNKFSVHIKKLSVEEIMHERINVLPSITKQPLKPVPAKKQKAASANQSNLF